MFERFTDRAIKSMMLAQEESRRLGHNFVGTEQILIGLLGENEGHASQALRKCGVSIRDARIEIERTIGRGPGQVAQEIPFTPRAKRLLECSWEEAQRLGHPYISTEHLLLGLIVEGTGIGCEILGKLGVDLQLLQKVVLSLAGQSTSSVMPSAPVTSIDPENLTVGPFIWYQTTATQCISAAIAAAKTLGQDTITPEHLLLGLVSDSASMTEILQEAALDPAKMRRALLKLMEPGEARPAQAVTFTSETNGVLSYAWTYAVHHNSLVTIECILIALLRQDNGIFRRLLRHLDADAESLRRITADRMGGRPHDSQPQPVLSATAGQSTTRPQSSNEPTVTLTERSEMWKTEKQRAKDISAGSGSASVGEDEQTVQLKSAIQQLTEAIRLRPTHTQNYIERGNSYYALDKKDKAVDDWDKALCLDENNLELRITRASALVELRRWKEAQAEVGTVLALNPRYSAAYHLRGQIFQHQRDRATALDSFNEAIKFNDNNSAYFTNRASLFMEMNGFRNAIADLETAIKLFDKNATAYNLLAACLLQVNQEASALSNAKKAVQLRDTEAHRATLAMIHFALGNFEEARVEFDTRLSSTTLSDQIIGVRAEVNLKLGRPNKSLDDCHLLITRNSTNARAYEIAARCHLLNGKQDLALDCFTKVLQFAPELQNIRYERAVLLSELNKPQEALSDLNRVLRKNPKDKEALFQRATINESINNWDEARKDYTDLLRSHPDSIPARLGLARCSAHLGSALETLLELTALAEQNPTDEVLCERASILAHLNRIDEAMAELQKALVKNPGHCASWGLPR